MRIKSLDKNILTKVVMSRTLIDEQIVEASGACLGRLHTHTPREQGWTEAHELTG